MDLEIINLVKQHGYSIFWLILGIFALIRLSEWILKYYYNKIKSQIDIVQKGVCEVEQPIIISNKQLFNMLCEQEKKVDECHKLCDDTNIKISEFCINSQESRTETKMLFESMKSMIEEMSHDIQRISDESGNVYKLIAERLLNGYRVRQNGSSTDNGKP